MIDEPVWQDPKGIVRAEMLRGLERLKWRRALIDAGFPEENISEDGYILMDFARRLKP